MGALWTPPGGVGLLKHHAKSKTVTLQDGRRALITVDDSDTVTHIESDDRLDCIVRPKTVTIQIRPREG